jgi:hypothetical protein
MVFLKWWLMRASNHLSSRSICRWWSEFSLGHWENQAWSATLSLSLSLCLCVCELLAAGVNNHYCALFFGLHTWWNIVLFMAFQALQLQLLQTSRSLQSVIESMLLFRVENCNNPEIIDNCNPWVVIACASLPLGLKLGSMESLCSCCTFTLGLNVDGQQWNPSLFVNPNPGAKWRRRPLVQNDSMIYI